MSNLDRRRFLQAGAGAALIPTSLSGLMLEPAQAAGTPTLVKRILTHTDFSGIYVAEGSIVRPDPLQAGNGAIPVVGPGYNSSSVTGLILPMTSQYQYNVNYWSVVQCGLNQASLWINGYGYHLAKDSGSYKQGGYHLGIGGGRCQDQATLPKVWDVAGQYLQFNHRQTVQTSSHLNGCFTQAYYCMTFYIPALKAQGFDALALHFTVPTWASRDTGGHRETSTTDDNTPGLGLYVSALLNANSKYVENWGSNLTFGGNPSTEQVIGFNITKEKMQNILNDWVPAKGFSVGGSPAYYYYTNPANWRFAGSSQVLEMQWPDAYRPASGGPMPGQCGIRYRDIEANIFRK